MIFNDHISSSDQRISDQRNYGSTTPSSSSLASSTAIENKFLNIINLKLFAQCFFTLEVVREHNHPLRSNWNVRTLKTLNLLKKISI